MKICIPAAVISLLFLASCSVSRKPSAAAKRPAIIQSNTQTVHANTAKNASYLRSNVVLKKKVPEINVDTHGVNPEKVVEFAKLQLGVPYVYGGMDKKKGFDCSGFINYVFAHFKVNVPRVTYMFTNVGVDIPIEYSKPGDLILFTGTNMKSGEVGHIGIITKSKNGVIEFIHASSSRGVVISTMNTYFLPRYVRVNRVFIPVYASR